MAKFISHDRVTHMEVLRVLINAFEAVFDGLLVFSALQYICQHPSGRYPLQSEGFVNKIPSIN